MIERRSVIRRLRAALVAVALVGAAGVMAPAAGPVPAVPLAAGLEKTHLRFGFSGSAQNYLPLDLAVDHTFRDQGLTGELIVLNAVAPVPAALASGSIDVAVLGLNTAVTMIGAGHPVKVFYLVSVRPDFEWFARPTVRDWGDLKGGSVAVSGFGSASDVLTRYVLQRHGFAATPELQIVQAGSSASRLAALQAGRVDAALLVPPFTWSAESLGFRRLGSQASEVSPEWPQVVLVASEKLLADSPRTVRALLRAYVAGVRLARSDQESAVRVLMERLRLDHPYAERAYAEVTAGLDERGRLPRGSMPIFWQIAIAAGEVTEAWPDSRFLDSRFIDSFEEWAPR